MGFGSRLVRKAVRRATPRTVRRAMHPVRTVKYAVTPRPVKQLSRAVYTVTNPLGALENKVIGAMLPGGHHQTRRGATSVRSPAQVAYRTPATYSPYGAGDTSTRAGEAAVMHDWLSTLMAVQRERFVEPQPPVVPPPPPVDPAPFRQAEWARRKSEFRFWNVSARKRIRAEVDQVAQANAAELYHTHYAAWQTYQDQAVAWWNGLLAGDPQILTGALVAAFADNPAPVRVHQAAGSSVALVVTLPGIEVLPPKKAHVTPTGRLSSKAWTKTERNEVYADLIGAHLLATIRETLVVGRCIANVRIVGVFDLAGGGVELLFDVDVERSGEDWADDGSGRRVLGYAKFGLRTGGRTQEVQPWSLAEMRADVAAIIA